MSLAGSFLVAQSSLNDPHFLRTVVLVLAHTDGGAFGLVVNRPAKKDGLPFPVFDGGPCPAPGLFMLHGHPDWAESEPQKDPEDQDDEEEPQREVAPGIFRGDPACLKRAATPAEGEAIRLRAYKGY